MWSTASQNKRVGGSKVIDGNEHGQVTASLTTFCKQHSRLIQDESTRDHLALHTGRWDTFEKMVVEVDAIARTRRIVSHSHGRLSHQRQRQGEGCQGG